MGDLGFLSKLLDKVQSHSTVVGKVWMSVLFLFRIMVLGAGVESVWGDEQSNLVCESHRKGCENVCYDWQFPISHVRFWVLQIITVSTPTLLYLAHAVHVIHKEDKLRSKLKLTTSGDCGGVRVLKAPKYTDEQGKVQIKGQLMCSYMAQLFAKILLEVGFIMGQYYLYGFFLVPKFECQLYPCVLKVECFMSRPTEKTIFIIFQLVVACVSVFLCLVEMLYLLCACRKRSAKRAAMKSIRINANAPSFPLNWEPHRDTGDSMSQNKANMAFEGGKDL